jgi:hypothetical protein
MGDGGAVRAEDTDGGEHPVLVPDLRKDAVGVSDRRVGRSRAEGVANRGVCGGDADVAEPLRHPPLGLGGHPLHESAFRLGVRVLQCVSRKHKGHGRHCEQPDEDNPAHRYQ